MDNIIIPDAPVTDTVLEKIQYVPPKSPVYGSYTRISFDAKTGEMVKDKYIKSKDTAFVLHMLSLLSVHGIGDFYCGRIARGFLKMFTLGGLYIWAISDIIKVRNGTYETRGKCVLM